MAQPQLQARIDDVPDVPVRTWEDSVLAEYRHIQPPLSRSIDEVVALIASGTGSAQSWQENIVAEIRQIQRGGLGVTLTDKTGGFPQAPSVQSQQDPSTSVSGSGNESEMGKVLRSELAPMKETLEKVVADVTRLNQGYSASGDPSRPGGRN